jgi:tetratricopeptide (TPR) repeat protein
LEPIDRSLIPRALVVAGLILLLPACRSALREPPGLEALATGAPSESAAEADELTRQAETRFAERTPTAVEEAADLWTRVAAGQVTRVEPLLNAVRARIWLADHAEGAASRRDHSLAAVQTAQWCTTRAPADPGCDYWLAAALGIQARERRSTALDALPRIIELFQAAADADPGLEHGGPDRALALAYVQAPGWPTGPGDPDLGLEHALRAVEIAPVFPPNHLALGDALDATEDPEGARKAYEKALSLAKDLAEAGDPDAPAWVEGAQKALNGT